MRQDLQNLNSALPYSAAHAAHVVIAVQLSSFGAYDAGDTLISAMATHGGRDGGSLRISPLGSRIKTTVGGLKNLLTFVRN